jgi:hypothetical protein
MAIAFVRAGALASAAASSVSPTFGQATTAGNLLICCAGANVNFGAIATPAGWTLGFAIGSGATGKVVVFYKPNCGAGETAPTLDDSANGSTQMYAVLAEFSGADTSAPLDKHGFAQSVLTTGSTAGANAGAGADLVISCWWINNSKSATATITAAYTEATASSAVLGSSAATKALQWFWAGYAIDSAAGASDSITLTVTPSTGAVSANEAGVIGSFMQPQSRHSLVWSDLRVARNGLLRRCVGKAWDRRPSGIFVPDIRVLLPEFAI